MIIAVAGQVCSRAQTFTFLLALANETKFGLREKVKQTKTRLGVCLVCVTGRILAPLGSRWWGEWDDARILPL